MTKELPYARAILSNPDAIPEARRRWHLAHCSCGGVLSECVAVRRGQGVRSIARSVRTSSQLKAYPPRGGLERAAYPRAEREGLS